MSAADTLKNNIGKFAFGSMGTIITIVGALFTVDARYAHADEVDKDKAQTQVLIKESSITLRRQMLEDKLFELDAKQASARDQKLPPVETAMKERYERQLKDIRAESAVVREEKNKANK